MTIPTMKNATDDTIVLASNACLYLGHIKARLAFLRGRDDLDSDEHLEHIADLETDIETWAAEVMEWLEAANPRQHSYVLWLLHHSAYSPRNQNELSADDAT